MTPYDSATEAANKKPNVLESLTGEIKNQENKESAEGAQVVQQTAEGIQGEVADVLEGIETGSGKVSEKAGERGEKRDFSWKGSAKSDDDQVTVGTSGVGQSTFPPQQVMVKEVVLAIRKEIKLEMKNAARLSKKMMEGNAKDFNESIARVRTLKATLQSVLGATVDFLKELYGRYVQGKKERKMV